MPQLTVLHLLDDVISLWGHTRGQPESLCFFSDGCLSGGWLELAVSLPTAGGGSLSREVFTWRKKKGVVGGVAEPRWFHWSQVLVTPE